ncbi:MAG: HAS-barrel domain-containing protein [Chloroherpetonaceae bacterium]
MNSEPIGEVIASNTIAFSAVVKSGFGDALPVKFGELVKTETNGMKIFGIVSLIEHAPTEPNRKVAPHGKSKAELKREMPQVFELLQTEFRALVVGYETVRGIVPLLPPVPPDLHDFAFLANEDEQKHFFSKTPSFLRTILNSRDASPDELLVAFLRNHHAYLSRPQLIAIGKELSYLLGDDHRRLESILSRVMD